MTQTTAMTGDDKHSTNKNGGLGMVYWVDHINGGGSIYLSKEV